MDHTDMRGMYTSPYAREKFVKVWNDEMQGRQGGVEEWKVVEKRKRNGVSVFTHSTGKGIELNKQKFRWRSE